MSNKISIAAILMASGLSKRFGSNKLLYCIDGIPIVQHVLNALPAERFLQTIVVTRYAEVAVRAAEKGFTIVENVDSIDDPSVTIRLGLQALRHPVDGCMFLVCDQPYLSKISIERLADAFGENPQQIAALSYGKQRGNPVIFPHILFEELAALPPGQGGTAVIRAHTELVHLVQAETPQELDDIDRPEDLKAP